MGILGFVKKQFIDIIEWVEPADGTLAWRFPMEDREIQNGGSLTVRESQMAVFVNEGKVADVFGPGRYTLTTATLPVLTYLRNAASELEVRDLESDAEQRRCVAHRCFPFVTVRGPDDRQVCSGVGGSSSVSQPLTTWRRRSRSRR